MKECDGPRHDPFFPAGWPGGKPFAAVMCNMPIWNVKNVLSFSVKFHSPGSDTKDEAKVRLLLFPLPGNHEDFSGMGKPGPKPIRH